jgi:hypothetical protein
MTVYIEKPAINLREKLAELDKPTGIAGEAMLRAETPQEQFNLIGAGRRNLIINGDMQVAQRGAGPFTNASGGYQTVDRFQLSGTMGGSFTLEQASDAPSGSGFSKSFKALAPTGFSSPTSSASARVITAIEGQNLQQLLKGSSNALPVTLSFWVKSVVAGTYIFELYDDDNNRTISTAYYISASNTWEKKIITIAGDTSGSLDNDANSSLSLVWWIGAGSNFTSGTLNTSWSNTVTANRAAGQVNGVASNNDAFYLTGVQLEVGKVATPFEHRSYGEELALCQRYYQTVNTIYHSAYNATDEYSGSFTLFPVTMRATPTTSSSGSLSTSNMYNFSLANARTSGFNHFAQVQSTGRGYYYHNDSYVAKFDAEL